MQRWRSLQNFSEKIKKDRDRRQKDGRSLARSLPDSHGQPGYFAVFLNSHPAQLSAPGETSRLVCASIIPQRRGFCNELCPYKTPTIPNRNPTERYNPETFPPHLSAYGVWESFRAVSKARRNCFDTNENDLQQSLRVPCGQTFDTPFPLSLFFFAERYGRLKIIRELYRLCFLRSPVYRDTYRKRCRFRAWFSLPL